MFPPDTHRQNIAERAIQPFKNHYIAILAGMDPCFPISLCCKLIPQAVLKLNLVQSSSMCPNVSAYAFMHVQFNYNVIHLGPLSCVVQVYRTFHRQKTWNKPCVYDWYLGTLPKHYQCHIIWNTKTKAEQIISTKQRTTLTFCETYLKSHYFFVCKIVNTRYTTIFHPGEGVVTMY